MVELFVTLIVGCWGTYKALSIEKEHPGTDIPSCPPDSLLYRGDDPVEIAKRQYASVTIIVSSCVIYNIVMLVDKLSSV